MRIGTAMGKLPENFRHLSARFGTEELVDLTMRCIEVPDVGYMAIWGVSNNARSYWDDAGAERLGFRPRQNSEDFAAAMSSRRTRSTRSRSDIRAAAWSRSNSRRSTGDAPGAESLRVRSAGRGSDARRVAFSTRRTFADTASMLRYRETSCARTASMAKAVLSTKEES
jgi:hypothetical protein